MVQKTFGIYAEDLSGCTLYIETGSEYIACWCKNTETKQVKAFEIFSFRESFTEDFEKLLDETRLHSRLLTTPFEKVICIWGNEECACIPAEFYEGETASHFIEVMFGEKNITGLYKKTKGDIVTVASLPQHASEAFNKNYAIASNVHKYDQLLKGQQSSDDAPGIIHLVFYQNHYIISVYKDRMLQLIQTFSYKVTDDVLYVILNIFKTYEIDSKETKVIASGLIDTSSPLYETLNAYLHNFSFQSADKDLYAAESFHDYPLHYFASFCQYDV